MWALFCGFPTLTFVYKGCPHELQVNWWCGIVWVCASKLLHDIFQKYTLFIGASQDPNGPSVVKNPCCSITPSQALSPFVLKLVEVSSWNAMADVSAMNQAAAWLQRRRSTKWRKEWQSRSNWKSKSGLGMFGLEKVQPWGAQTMESLVFLL